MEEEKTMFRRQAPEGASNTEHSEVGELGRKLSVLPITTTHVTSDPLAQVELPSTVLQT